VGRCSLSTSTVVGNLVCTQSVAIDDVEIFITYGRIQSNHEQTSIEKSEVEEFRDGFWGPQYRVNLLTDIEIVVYVVVFGCPIVMPIVQHHFCCGYINL
jgi:hypothetical protein